MSNQKTQNVATLTETVFLQNRLRLVPLSLSLSCVTRNKTWGHKTLERRESRKRKQPRIKLSGFVSWSLTLRASCMPPRFRAVIFSPRFMYTVPMDVLIVLTQGLRLHKINNGSNLRFPSRLRFLPHPRKLRS